MISGDETKEIEVDDYYDSIRKNLDCIEDATKVYLEMKGKSG